MKPLLIFGTGDLAQVASIYFTKDSDYTVVAFVVDRERRSEHQLLGYPVLAYDEALERCPPDTHEMFVAISYSDLNRHRGQVVERVRAAGYRLASYVSSEACVWTEAIGDNVMITDHVSVHPFVRIGDGVVLWSGTVIGEGTTLGRHGYLGPAAIIGGHVTIGDYCVIGPNAYVASYRTVGSRNFIGATSRIFSDTPDDALFLERETPKARFSASQLPPMLAKRLFQDIFRKPQDSE